MTRYLDGCSGLARHTETLWRHDGSKSQFVVDLQVGNRLLEFAVADQSPYLNYGPVLSQNVFQYVLCCTVVWPWPKMTVAASALDYFDRKPPVLCASNTIRLEFQR